MKELIKVMLNKPPIDTRDLGPRCPIFSDFFRFFRFFYLFILFFFWFLIFF